MHQESKWDGLLDIEEPSEPSPHRPRGRASICALIAAMSLLAGVVWWIWSMPAPTRPPAAMPTDHATNLNPTPATPTPAPTHVTSAPPHANACADRRRVRARARYGTHVD